MSSESLFQELEELKEKISLYIDNDDDEEEMDHNEDLMRILEIEDELGLPHSF